MKRVVYVLIAIFLLSACNTFDNRTFYYAYVQKESNGTVVRSDSVSSNHEPSYTTKAMAVADDVLTYKQVEEVAVFYTGKHVIIGYSLKNQPKKQGVPSTTDGLTSPPNIQALNQAIMEKVKNGLNDDTISVHVGESAAFKTAFKDFMNEIKSMDKQQVNQRMKQIIDELNR